MRGNSGADLQFCGDYVEKRCANAREQLIWFGFAQECGLVEGITLPYVELVDAERYRIEFVAGSSGTAITSTQDLQKLVAQVELWRDVPAKSVASWDSYLARLEGHVKEGDSPEMRRAFELVTEHTLPSSFAHGDLTLENVLIRKDGEMVLIDPNYGESLFQSWVLDLGKLLQSVHSDYHRLFNSSPGADPAPLCKYLSTYLGDALWQQSLVAELTHLIRLRKYRPVNERSLVDCLVNRVYSEILSV